MSERFTFFLCSICCLSICCLSAPAQSESEKHAAWMAALRSEKFEERKAASIEIWSGGRGNLDFLNLLIAGDDPELATRAVAILRKVKLGITPETSEEVSQLLDQYFEATAKEKIILIEKLLALEEYNVLLRLREFEDNETVIGRIDQIIADLLPGVVRRHLNEGEIALAKECLALSVQFDHVIHYAHLLQVTGDLDEEIARLSQSESEEDQARYLIYLRVRAEAQLLQTEATRLGDRDAQTLASLCLGDHLPYLRNLLEASNPTLADQLYIKWTIANHEGNRAAEKEAYDALVSLMDQKRERKGARVSLLRMGYGELVLGNLSPSEDEAKIPYLLAHDRYAEVQEILTLPFGEEGEFEQWLEDISTRIRKELDEQGRSPALSRLNLAVRFLEERGLKERAIKGGYALFDLIRPVKDLNARRYAHDLYFVAPFTTLTVIARELSEHGASLDEFFEMLPIPASDESLWLLNFIGEMDPEMELRERLLVTMSFSAQNLLVSPELFKRVRDRVFDEVKKDDDRVNSLRNLLNLMVNRNRKEDLLMICAALAEEKEPDHFVEAILALDGGQIKEGAEALAKIEGEASSESAEFLYRKGLVFKNAGKEGGEEAMKRALLLSNGSALALRDFAMEHLRLGEIEEAYELMRRALLRTENPAESSRVGIRNSIIEELASEAVTLGRWQNVLAYREVSLFSRFNGAGSVEYGIYLLRPRFQILLARGAVAMEQGDEESAVRAFSRAHEILPSDGYLANDFFPLLRNLGLSELHDQLYEKTITSSRESIRRYPKDHNVYNNFAWMASRANRSLDEAEGYLKIALSLNPESAAYLDTMGEIYFARRDREKAVAWSDRSVQNSILGSRGSRWELQYQNLRFREQPFPVE